MESCCDYEICDHGSLMKRCLEQVSELWGVVECETVCRCQNQTLWWCLEALALMPLWKMRPSYNGCERYVLCLS